jgi:2-hydroxychromene-2-carboxylate isomerase
MGSVEQRDPHHWRRVRYSYMDARRFANKQGLTLKGPLKVFYARPANADMLYAQKHDVFRAYNDLVFGRFWRRELDPESVDALTAVMAEIGAPPDFASFLAGEGGAAHDRLRNEAEASGVFGGADLRFRRRAVLGRRPDRPVARAAGREGGETPARLTTICRRSP